MHTYDSNLLFTDTFKYVDTHGLPLAFVMTATIRAGLVPSLPHFYRDALRAGWSPETAFAKIEEAIQDCGPPPEWKHAPQIYLDNIKIWLRPITVDTVLTHLGEGNED